MNNRERAERIVQKYKGQYSLTAAVEYIAAQIDEAVKEERRGWKDAAAAVVRLSSQDARAKGYAAAREQAAKAVEFQVGTSLETAFDRALVDGAISVIRAMSPASSAPGPQEEYSHEKAFSEAANLVEAQKMKRRRLLRTTRQ